MKTIDYADLAEVGASSPKQEAYRPAAAGSVG